MDYNLGNGAKNVGRDKYGKFIKGHKSLSKRSGNLVLCENCKKEFYKSINSKRKFCSQTCYWKFKKGKHHSWGYKISQKMKNKKKTPEHIMKVANANRGQKRPNISGENHWNWQGGKSFINERWNRRRVYRLWKKTILERDNFTCQKCKKRGGELVGHHIFNFADFPEFKLSIDNGITLCKNCHIQFHKKYGKRNNTKEQLEEFLNDFK